MRIRFFSFLIIVSSSFLLSSCSEYFIREFMSGPETCPPEEMNKVVDNRRAIRHLTLRLRREYVLNAMSYKPDKTEVVTTVSGNIYIVDYYQIASTKICGGEEKWGGFEAVYYHEGVLIGKGVGFYQHYIEPYIAKVEEVKN